MKTEKSLTCLVLSLSLLSSALLSGCVPLDDNWLDDRNDPYYDDYYYRRERERARDERRDLERERDRLERERDRLERERDRDDPPYRSSPPPPPPPRREERCPPGFSPSERKCSPDERRNGCRDIRLPGGLGCVSR